MIKNTAGQAAVQCQVTNATTGAPFTGAVTVYVCGDGGTRAIGTVGGGAATHEGGGLHSYAPSQAETNYDRVSFQFEGTGAITSAVHFTTAVDLVSNALDSDSFASTAVNKMAERLGSSQAAIAQTGTASTITLVAGALATNDIHNGMIIAIRQGTGNGQSRLITAYNGTTKVATVTPNWTVTPDATSEYSILPQRLYTVAEIQSGLATSAALATVQSDTDDIQSRLPAALVSGRIDASTGAMAAGVLTATAIAADAITAAKVAADVTTEIQAGLATAANLATAQTDLTTLIGRLTAIRAGYLDNLAEGPVAQDADIVSVLMDTAALLARLTVLRAGYLDNLSAGAVALASALATVQADTDNIQTRLPAALVSGRIDASVGAMAADTVTAASIAGDAVTELQSGIATSAALGAVAVDVTTVIADTNDIQTRIPAALVSGRMDSSIGAMAANVLTAAALAADAVTELTDAIKAMTIEGSRTFAQTMRGLWSLGLTKASGFDTGTIVTRDAADTKNRMTVVTGSTGRTSVTVGDLD